MSSGDAAADTTCSPSPDLFAAQRALADQPGIVLDAEAWEQWEELNRRPARDLPRLREFMQRPAPVFDN